MEIAYIFAIAGVTYGLYERWQTKKLKILVGEIDKLFDELEEYRGNPYSSETQSIIKKLILRLRRLQGAIVTERAKLDLEPLIAKLILRIQ